MSSRDNILARLEKIRKNEPFPGAYPAPANFPVEQAAYFADTLKAIGGEAIRVGDTKEVLQFVKGRFPEAKSIRSPVPELSALTGGSDVPHGHQELAKVDVAILRGRFAVAENGAVWLTQDQLGAGALPFICEHLILIIPLRGILRTMHEAYEQIGDTDYDFGTFIAGPSKTADIEQSLVLGAQGPRSLTVCIVENEPSTINE